MKERQYKIGIVGWSLGENSFGAQKPYLHHLGFFGEVQILTPMYGIVEDLDLVVLPGGKDMPSFLYNEPPSYLNSDSDQFKEWFMHNNFQQYVDAGIPIWGTCLGFQQICVKFGGKLCQNIPTGHGYSEKTRDELVNDLFFTSKYIELENTLLVKRKSKSAFIKVCSLHHQGIYMEDVPDSLEVIAHTKDRIVEFVKHKELPIAGGQSHVEEDFNPVANYLIKELLERSPNVNHENSKHSSGVSR